MKVRDVAFDLRNALGGKKESLGRLMYLGYDRAWGTTYWEMEHYWWYQANLYFCLDVILTPEHSTGYQTKGYTIDVKDIVSAVESLPGYISESLLVISGEDVGGEKRNSRILFARFVDFDPLWKLPQWFYNRARKTSGDISKALWNILMSRDY